MEETKIKICGITNLADARFVAGARVDYLGFIFYDKSHRYIEPGQAGAMINWIEGPKKVGVFVNQPLDDVNLIARQTGVDFVQLHGSEAPEYCSLVEKPIIKALHVKESTTAKKLQKEIKRYRPLADYMLLDTSHDAQWGGTGESFDWEMLEEVNSDLPFFLSGGLDVNNIDKACRTVRPYGVDVASGLESEPGVKDFDKIEQFMSRFEELKAGTY